MTLTLFRRALLTPLGIGAFLAASLCASTGAQAQQSAAIVIKNFMFSPMSLTIKAGSSVTWKNLDAEPHTVVEDAGLFRSGALDQNDSYTHTFDKPGVYKIFCGIHPYMKETLTVQ
jgi:plastocyanin